LARFDCVAAVLTGKPNATATEAVDWIEALVRDLRIPSLATYGIGRSHFPELVEKSSVASSMKANPVVLASEEITKILDRAL
jgi:alcohol dehydrogenase class IV